MENGMNIHTLELIDLLIPPREDNNNLFGLFIIMEYFGADLKSVMSIKPSVQNFSPDHALLIMYNILCAL